MVIGFSHGRVLVQACVLARRHRDMGQIFAGGAELVHVALRGEGVIGDGGEMAPRLFPMLVAVADRMARRRIGSGAFARMDAHDRVGHAGFDGHHRVLDHGDRGRATESEIRGISWAHARHIRHAHGVTSVRIVKRLVGDEAVDLRGFDPGVVEASFDAFEME